MSPTQLQSVKTHEKQDQPNPRPKQPQPEKTESLEGGPKGLRPPLGQLIGTTWNRWTVLDEKMEGKRWLFCRCSCGTERWVDARNVRASNLRKKGTSKSCGCLNREIVKVLHKTHGRAYSKVYKTLYQIKDRCLNSNNPNFYRYGGRGITLCKRWEESFENFLEDMGEPPSPKHSIDRIDNNGNYEPGNCRWATMQEQARNKRGTLFLETPEGKVCLTEWCQSNNAPYSTAARRFHKGRPHSEIMDLKSYERHLHRFRKLSKTGNVIEEFDSAITAASSAGVSITSIRDCANGKNNTAGGYRWERF